MGWLVVIPNDRYPIPLPPAPQSLPPNMSMLDMFGVAKTNGTKLYNSVDLFYFQ
jgi:hypothetical protein